MATREHLGVADAGALLSHGPDVPDPVIPCGRLGVTFPPDILFAADRTIEG